jgi:hypothetical protein
MVEVLDKQAGDVMSRQHVGNMYSHDVIGLFVAQSVWHSLDHVRPCTLSFTIRILNADGLLEGTRNGPRAGGCHAEQSVASPGCTSFDATIS